MSRNFFPSINKVIFFFELSYKLMIMVVGLETNESNIVLPSWMIVCNRNSPPIERNACIKNSINTLLPIISTGVLSLNISGIDPYQITRANIQYMEGPLKMHIEISNGTCNGLSRGQVKTVRSKINDTNLVILLNMFFSEVYIQGHFQGETHLGEALITSNGHVNITGSLITTKFKISGNVKEINRQKHMIINEMKIVNNQLKGMQTDAVGLSTDRDLNALVLEFVNQNWRALYLQFFPQMKYLFEPLLVEMANDFFSHVPYDILMPS